MSRIPVTLGAVALLASLPHIARCQAVDQWHIGVAAKVITPSEPLWLAGYGHRNRPADFVLQDVWAKALALQDAEGNKGVVVTTDLCGLSVGMYSSLCEKFQREFGLDRSRVTLNFSHNHCAPVTNGDLVDYYPLDEEQQGRVDRYSAWLEDALVELVGAALADLKPATLWLGEGLCTFAVNRRNNTEDEVPGMLERGETPRGPVDHTVPVLAARDADGALMAVVFGYACHNTTLAFMQMCGDYAGFAQDALERNHPGTKALFFMGCGGDQNPIPRRSLDWCVRYGNMLAASVEQAIDGPLTPVGPSLRTAFGFTTFEFEANPTREELEATAKEADSVHTRWAKRLLRRLDNAETFEKTFEYPASAWRLGNELLWINLGAEAVVDYSLRFKSEYGPGTWVGGYSHMQVSYIPSRRVWEEGGYEGGFIYEYGHPATRWTGDVEDRVSALVHRLVDQVR